MPRLNWKSLLLLTVATIAGAAVLVSGIVATVRLPLLGWTSLLVVLVLMVVTGVSSWFTVPMTPEDGATQSDKSLADAFIFLSVMMFTMAPANNFGPAILLAGIAGFVSSLPDRDHK